MKKKMFEKNGLLVSPGLFLKPTAIGKIKTLRCGYLVINGIVAVSVSNIFSCGKE